jgi:hypothetical protein
LDRHPPPRAVWYHRFRVRHLIATGRRARCGIIAFVLVI